MGDKHVDTEALRDQLRDSGYILDCIPIDLNLYVIGNDLGIMISRMLQAQLDATN